MWINLPTKGQVQNKSSTSVSNSQGIFPQNKVENTDIFTFITGCMQL